MRAGSEVVALSLTPMEGIAPQNLQVKFSYFLGRIAWRPILVSLALLLLTNVAGAIMFGREMFGVVRARRRARAAAGRLRAEWLTGDAQAAALVGSATYDDIVARWGPPDENRERLSTPGRRTVVYRTRKQRPGARSGDRAHGRPRHGNRAPRVPAHALITALPTPTMTSLVRDT